MPKKLTVICCIKCKREFANNNLTVHYERMHGTKEQKEKVRQKLKKIRNVFKICPTCNEEFKLEGNSQKRFCSKDCRNKRFRKGLDSNKLNKLDYRDYRSKCDFTFNLKDFEDDFDFSLIQEHGWYSPSNKGNNLTRYKQRSYGKCEIWI